MRQMTRRQVLRRRGIAARAVTGGATPGTLPANAPPDQGWTSLLQPTALYGRLIKPEGRIFFAGEHASLSHTWMQGAFESALRALLEITQILTAT